MQVLTCTRGEHHPAGNRYSGNECGYHRRKSNRYAPVLQSHPQDYYKTVHTDIFILKVTLPE